MPRLQIAVRLSVVAAIAAVSLGCGRREPDYEAVGMAQASGTVTLDGEPLEGAVVRFYNTPERVRYAYGQTDEEGRYSLRFNSSAEGVLPGEKIVVVSTALTGPEVVGGGGPERIPAQYNRDSELTRTVDPGGSHTFDFDLKSDGEIAEPVVDEESEAYMGE